MASEERTHALLEGAGFGVVRTDEVPLRFGFADMDEYMSVTADTAGPIGLALQGLSEDEREALKSQLRQAFTPFASDGGYEFPGVAICALAS